MEPLDHLKRETPLWKAEIMPNLMTWKRENSIMLTSHFSFRAHLTHLSSEVGKMMCVTKMNSTTQKKNLYFFKIQVSKVPNSPWSILQVLAKSESPIPTRQSHTWPSIFVTSSYHSVLQYFNFKCMQIKKLAYFFNKVVEACDEFFFRR